MTALSNVTKEEMEQILCEFRKTHEVSVPDHIKVKDISEPHTECEFAEDTGEIAFLRAPCRGNKIICKKISGHVSFTRACNSEFCKYYEKKTV